MKTNLVLFGTLSTLALATGCAKTNGTTTPNLAITGAIDLVQKGVSKIGTGMTSASGSGARLGSNLAVTPFVSSLCNAHGQPMNGSSQMDQGNLRYPYVHTYCALTVNDGDTVRGGFSLARQLACALEKAGIEFNGAQQTLNISFDAECFPDGGPEEGMTSLEIIATGSSPASFNNHYQKGVIFSVPSIGLEFKMGANFDSDKVEFIAHENWNGANAGESAGDTGVMAGEITKSTGALKFEKRDERIRSTCNASRCGWNRHTRLMANLSMSNGEPDNLIDFEYGYSDISISKEALASSALNTSRGTVITAKGALAGQIKARLFSTSNKTTAQMQSVGQWSETANAACASGAGIDDAATCSSQSGIGLFTTDTKFTLYSSPTQTSPANWLTQFSGFNFSSVNLNTDNAF